MATYRAVNDDDFTEDGKGKPDLKFYESDDGVTPKDASTPATEPTKENKDKYVVEVAAEAEAAPAVVGGDAPAVVGGDAPAAVAADTAVGGDADAGVVDEETATLIYHELRRVIDINLTNEKKHSKATIDAGIKKFEQDPKKNQRIEDPVVEKGGEKPEDDAHGGRRRTKRKGRKDSKKSKKGAKKSKKSSQSQKGGRRRSSKNRRKHSRRLKH